MNEMTCLPQALKRVIVGITGASGVVYGQRLLEVLRKIDDVETHVVVTAGARRTAASEMGVDPKRLDELADVSHRNSDLAAAISSGSFRTSGMIVAPCSIKSLSAIANCYDDTLLTRAADVTLKERRPLVLALRETPLHLGHIRLMLRATEMGATIAPPVPAFYNNPATIADIVDYTVRRLLDQVGIELPDDRRWTGTPPARPANVVSGSFARPGSDRA